MAQWIKVNNPYSGIDTNGLVVQPGTYPVGAPELYGASDGLVEHGAGEWVDFSEIATEEVAPVESAESQETALEDLSNADLRLLLDAQGIDHSKAKNKPALLALFEAGE